MIQILKYQRISNESEEEYIYRVCSDKDLIGSWGDVADIINGELGYEYTESKYRKQYQSFQKMFEANSKKIFNSGDSAVEELKKARDELHKAKVQFYDQRREYNKGLTEDSRFEHLTERLYEVASNMNQEFPISEVKFGTDFDRSKEAVLAISDIHYGMVTENVWNVYNVEICKRRLRELCDKTIKYLILHKPTRLHVILLGDSAHGAIHVNARVASEEDTCDQLMHVSEILAEMIGELSSYVDSVRVYSTYGNHLRTVQNKKESTHSDNMEKIIPWWMKQRFAGRDDITVVDSEYYEFIYLSPCGYNIVATHGDLDSFKNMGIVINSIFTRMYGTSIDYTISGDKHHLEEFEQFGIESTLVRSLCGSDEYSNSKRLYSNPGQTLMIFSREEGKECTYNIKFSI